MKNEIELAPYIEDLSWALENKIESDKIENELKNYLNKFDLPLNEAKRCVIKKFGGNPQILGNLVDRTISELSLDDNSVNLLCRILYVDEKEITVNGKAKTIFYGILGDTTGTVPFTAWHELNCTKGEVVRIYNAYTRSWNDKPQVNLGDKTHIRILEPDALPEIKCQGEAKTYQVNAFQDGLRNVSTILRILEINEQCITLKDEEQQVFKGIAADETGKCKFAAWNDFQLNRDDVIKVTGGYIRSWHGVPELQLNGSSNVEKLSNDALPNSEILSQDMIYSIKKLKKLGGVSSIAVEGIILDIRPGSGLIKRCPECNRALQNEQCMIHGKVEGEFDLRVKGVLDDGTGALSVVIGKENTEQILGLDMNGCINRAKEQMRYDVIFDDLVDKLLAKPFRLTGTVLSDEFGLMMINAKPEAIVPKIKNESTDLLVDLGVNIENEV